MMTSPPKARVEPAIQVGLKAVVQDLRNEGLDARFASGSVYLGIGQTALVIPWSQLQTDAGGHLHGAALRVALRLRDNRPLMFDDVVTHLGASPEDAVIGALRDVWLHGVLPPILPLIGGPQWPDVDTFRRGDEFYCPPWVIYAGPYQFSGPRGEAFVEGVRERPPLFVVRELLERHVDREHLHWLKLYRSRDEDNGADEADCFLDGQKFEAGKRALLKWKWPSISGRHTFRQFLVLLPEDRA
jgi:uncharacterized protein DUF6348